MARGSVNIMKRIYVIFIVIVAVVISGYLYIRFSLLKAKDFKPENSTAKSVLDLRPAIIAKLQQLVKDGSDGLYYLSIEKIQLQLVSLKVDVTNAAIIPDSNALRTLDSAHTLSDDIFKVSFSSLHLSGIGIKNLLSTNHLSLKHVSITNPVIELYHQKRWYNKEKRAKNNFATLYQKLVQKVKSISIDKVSVTGGTIINHDLDNTNNTSRFNDVEIQLQNLLVDSSTQFDKSRFLLAKQATLSTKSFSAKTPDNLYAVTGGAINISTIPNNTIHPDSISSRLDLVNVRIRPDTMVLKKSARGHMLPDDLFKISLPSLHLDGTGIDHFFRMGRFSLKNISIIDPVIERYHQKRWYNKEKRAKNNFATLYQKLTQKVKSISIDKIRVTGGTFINHDFDNTNNTSRFNDVSVQLQNILVDSSTQFDKSRFLFAKQATLSTKNFSGETPDRLYLFRCRAIRISTAENSLIISGFELHPIGGKQQFESKLSVRKEMYDIDIPKITLSNVNWPNVVNGNAMVAKQAVVNNGTCKVFLDRSKPFRNVKQNNFPHQMLMRIPVRLSIAKLKLVNSNLSYSEYNPGMAKTGIIYINDINGSVTNLTNMAAVIKRNRMLTITSSAIFMHKVPLTNRFQFDLSKYKTGDFAMDLDIGAMDSSILNPISAPMGEFMIKKGTIQRGIAHVKGDNYKAEGDGILLYKDLYLVALKKDKDRPGGIKKKTMLSFLGNLLLIKNANPSKGEAPRYKYFESKREPHTTFMSLVWKTIYIGILKTIGLPASFANKSY
jgi:hypothetical protein